MATKQTTWKLKYKSKLRIIDLVFSGNVTGSDIREATSKTISLSHEHGIFEILVDTAHLERTETTTDIYDLPQQYVEEDLDHRSRLAVVVPISPDLQGIMQFYENVCVNRGWRVKSFPNRREATAWLLTNTTSSESPDG